MADQEAPADSSQQQPANAATELLGGKMAEQMPEVDLATVSGHQQAAEPLKPAENQQKPAPEPSPSPAAPASKTALVDAQGRTFNPLLHETDEHGQPVLRKGTSILKCRRVPLKEAKQESRVELGDAPAPAPDAAAAPGDQPQPQPQPAAVDPAKQEAMQRAGAATMAGLQIQLMKLALGEHTANTNEEREALVECWRETFAHYGMGAVHPLVGLSLITGAVVMKAINQPEGRSRWQRFTMWTRVKVGGLWLWLTGKRKPKEEPTEREAEAERQAA